MVLFCCVTWEQRKLGEIANIQKGQQLGKAEMSDVGTYYVLNGGQEASGYTNQYNTLANTISISEGGNSCGYVSLNLEHFWSGGHNYTLQNPKIDTIFLYQLLKGHEKEIMALRVGSGLPNIQKSSLQDVYVTYPSAIEQRAIAQILIKIDNLITLHQRKCAVKNSKKMEQKIRYTCVLFPNAWEQRKLGDEANELIAGGDIDKDLIGESGCYPVIANAFTNDGIVGYYQNYYRVKAPAVTVTGRGDVGHAQARKVNFTPVVRLLTIKSSHNVDFLENAINRGEVIIESTGVPQLTVPQLSKRMLSFPQSLLEEEKIGAIFFKIDNLITLHQRGLIKIQGDKNGKKRSFRRIIQRLF